MGIAQKQSRYWICVSAESYALAAVLSQLNPKSVVNQQGMQT
jgi:hypothetical protein